ncbi:hypothetical protein V5799_000434 [Amblyomma americanum]|uniref:Uncharacterized protein n=1 Tax=Amblyomma americanum TaxID=6943 RepID=A0AAQ4D325_AMBAM
MIHRGADYRTTRPDTILVFETLVPGENVKVGCCPAASDYPSSPLKSHARCTLPAVRTAVEHFCPDFTRLQFDKRRHTADHQNWVPAQAWTG